MNGIPLFAPKRQNEALLAGIQDKILSVIKSGHYILGPEVSAFEKSLSKALGYGHAVGTSSGTDALILCLKAIGMKPEDEVITPAFSFVASTNVIPWVGAKPVFADVSPETACITAESVYRVMSPRTKAIIAVDLFGRQAPIRELKKLADAHGIYLIEDGAQSIGVPNLGAHFYTTSFYPTKNMGCIGDGGAVLTDNSEMATRVREMTVHGGLIRDHYMRPGTTARLDALQAAILNLKLPKLDAWTAQRRTVAQWYQRHLGPLEAGGGITLPKMDDPTKGNHVWALYSPRFKQRAQAFERLRGKGIGCAVYYPKAIPTQPAYAATAKGEWTEATKWADEVLSLPLFPELTAKEFEVVIRSVAECLTRTSM